MALENTERTEYLYHHSDRGLQHCSNEYIRILEESDIRISMTQSGDPRDNAIAERVNGIIKNEYLCGYDVNSLEEGKEVLDFVVTLYNEERPHMSLGNLTPEFVHVQNGKSDRLWRNYYQKSSNIVNAFQDYDKVVNLLQDDH